MRRRWLFLAVLATLASASAASADGPLAPGDPIVQDATEHLLAEQDESTGCIEDDHRSTVWTTLALAAAHRDPDRGDPSLVDGLREACSPSTADGRNELNTYARHVLALVAAGEDPRSFAGEDWVDKIRSYHAGGGFVSPDHPDAINDDAFAIIALRAAGVPADDDQIQQASQTLLDAQNADGGWGMTATSSSETDYTAAIVEALTRADAIDPHGQVARDAEGYLSERVDDGTGCMSRDGSGDGNAYSTAWGLRALLTLHEDPRASERGSPWTCLLDQREGDGFGSTWLTWEAVPALVGVPHGRVTATMDEPASPLSTTSTPQVGETTTLQAEGVAFAGWRLPDGTVLEGAQTPWTPTEAGEVEIDVLLVDADGRAAATPFTTTVEQAPEDSSSASEGTTDDEPEEEAEDETEPQPRPTAELTLPDRAERNVTFTARVDGDPAEHPITAFRLEAPGLETVWQPAGTFEVTVDAIGQAQLTAWARDADGHVSEPAHANLTLVDATPRVAIEGPENANRSEPVRLTADARDPDGRITNLTWTGPDGSTANGTHATFSFAAPGPNQVRAEAEDAAANTANATWTVHARNRAPVNVAVQPGELEANASQVLQARAQDPDGDPLDVAWLSPGADQPRSWGRQLHLETGPPGERELIVNVSDPYDAWTTARVTIPVREQPDEDTAADLANLTTQTPEPRADPPEPATRSPPTVELPDRIHAQADRHHPIEVPAHSPEGSLVNVTVALGGPVPVQGTDPARALLPALPAGEYELAARAADEAGWGPWTNTTLVVEPPPDAEEALEPASGAQPERSTPLAAWLAAAALSLAAGRRRA